MIKHTQSKVSVFNSEGKEVQAGNCWQTTIASLIDYTVHDVPNFETWFNYNSSDDNYYYNWYVMTEKWLKSKGFKLSHANYAGIAYHEEYRKRSLENRLYIDKIKEEFFKEVASTVSDRELIEFLQEYCKNDIYMVSGDSPRGNDITHVAIYQQGKLIHDVHPSREGIKTFEVFYRILKVNN